jgi:threonine synthase
MKFYSTNNRDLEADMQTAILEGLAPDGGLYYPQNINAFTAQELSDLKGKDLKYVAYHTLYKWFGNDIPEDKIKDIVNKASDFDIPIVAVSHQTLIELFHGPTMAFKDVAAKYLAQIMSFYLQKKQSHVNLLVATSGDTGGAIAQGFANVDNINVYVLFPKGKVSKLQEEQLTRVADNVISLEIDGVFDDCQHMVKKAFVDADLQHLNMTSANSISVGRIIPQIIYYVYAYAHSDSENIEFTIPSGNFGNLTAALFAKSMGIPITKLHAATNQNDLVVKYYNTGDYTPQQTISTLSNAMDVGNPSNFARILQYFDHDHSNFAKVIDAHKVSDQETIDTILEVYQSHGYLLDPHTAVAWTIANRINTNNNFIVSTASPIKFAQEIKNATGIDLDDSEQIAKLQSNDKRKKSLSNEYSAFKDFLQTNAK